MPKKRNSRAGLIDVLFNVVIPMVIMTKFNKAELLWPVWALVIALLFPLFYGIVEWYRSQHTNVFSVVWLVSILLTWWIWLLHIPAEWVAVKEAGIPLLLGIGVLIAIRFGYPVAKIFILQALDQEKIEESVANDADKQRQIVWLEKLISYVFAGSFFVSALLNYLLAIRIVTAAPGTEEFTAQLGRMTGLSFPVIAIPLMIVLMIAVGYMLRRLGKLTWLPLEELVST